MMKETMLFLIKSIRPKLNFALFIGVLMGLVVSNSFNGLNIGVSAFIMFLHGFAVFSLNDYFDRDTDRHAEEENFKGTFGRGEERNLLFYSSMLSIFSLLIIGFFLGRNIFYPILGICLFSVLYSVPPIRLKARPFLDSISNGVWVLLIFTFGIALGNQSFSIPVKAYWMAGFLSGFHALASLPDIEADRKAGLKTTGMILGWRKTIMVEIGLILISFFFIEWSLITTAIILIFLVYLIYILIFPDEGHFYRGLKIMVPASIVYGVSWILVSII